MREAGNPAAEDEIYMGTIVAVCTSERKGELKKDVGAGLLIKGMGLAGDAHAGFGHRQISLLAEASIESMREKGLRVGPGDFAENLTVAGMRLYDLPVGTRLRVGETAVLRVTQIGKECHHHCAVYQQAGDCVMPREGIFTEVLAGGPVRSGDAIRLAPSYRFGVITASDKGSQGEREDAGGPLIREFLLPWGDAADCRIIPDDRSQLGAALREMADGQGLDLIVTTGGTGLSPRDVTPEATLDVVERLVPGIPEAMRAAGLAKTPKAMLSRGVAGIRGRTLIINLPGSPRAVSENLESLASVLEHALEILSGRGGECGAECGAAITAP